MKTNQKLFLSCAIIITVCGGLSTICIGQPDSSIVRRAIQGAPLEKAELDKVWKALAQPAPARLETNWIKEESVQANPKVDVQALINEANVLQSDLKTPEEKQRYKTFIQWRDNDFKQQRDGYERTTGLHAVRINREIKVELVGSDENYPSASEFGGIYTIDYYDGKNVLTLQPDTVFFGDIPTPFKRQTNTDGARGYIGTLKLDSLKEYPGADRPLSCTIPNYMECLLMARPLIDYFPANKSTVSADGNEIYVDVPVREQGGIQRLILDSKSLRPVKIMQSRAMDHNIWLFSTEIKQYKEVNGVAYPAEIVASNIASDKAGGMRTTYRLKDIKVNEDVASKSTSLPLNSTITDYRLGYEEKDIVVYQPKEGRLPSDEEVRKLAGR